MGEDQLGTMDVRQWELETKRGPGCDRFPRCRNRDIHHRKAVAVAVGRQQMFTWLRRNGSLSRTPTARRALPRPLVGAGMLIPGVSQCLRRGLNRVCLRMHSTALRHKRRDASRKRQMRPPKRPQGGHFQGYAAPELLKGTCRFPKQDFGFAISALDALRLVWPPIRFGGRR